MRVISGSQKSGDEWWEEFQELLDEQNDWPTEYTFKFIAPSQNLEPLKSVFGDHPVQVRSSSKGNYMSVTARMHMESSEEVLAIYEEAADIEGVISL